MNTPDGQQRDRRYREFVCLLAANERRLTAYIHALIPLWQDAEDVLQNTKLRLWEQFDSFRPDADFSAWAIAIASYMVRTHRTLCKRERLSFSEDVLDKLAQSIPSANPPGHDDRLSALVECVKSLNDFSRGLLRLVFAGNRQIKEIAHDLGQTPAATRMVLLRCRRSLRECVEKRLQEGGGKGQ